MLNGASINSATAGILVAFSFLTSAISATFGIGGGVAMLAVLLNLAPPAIAIPVHGVIQFGSNAGRAVIMRKNVMFDIVPWFVIGTVAGVLVASLIFFSLPKALLQTVLAAFILWSVWAPKWRAAAISNRSYVGVGALGSFCTMFLGATGPMLAAFLSPERYGRDKTVATHATCMTLQHLLKVLAFVGLLGFALLPWLGVITLMIIGGFAGTVLGRHLLNKIDEHYFKIAFKIVLSLLALRLLWGALR